jgi:hypothetical protein
MDYLSLIFLGYMAKKETEEKYTDQLCGKCIKPKK